LIRNGFNNDRIVVYIPVYEIKEDKKAFGKFIGARFQPLGDEPMAKPILAFIFNVC
jgi:hypothetical protein